MNIVIHLKGHYDWEPAPKTIAGELLKLIGLGKPPKGAKLAADGTVLTRVVREKETHTIIGLQESEIVNLSEHFERKDTPKTRAQVVAWYIEHVVMPHHAQRSDWLRIEVEEDKRMEHVLNKILFAEEEEPEEAVEVELLEGANTTKVVVVSVPFIEEDKADAEAAVGEGEIKS